MYPGLIFTCLLMALAQLPALHPLFAWDASLIRDGEWWRLLSGNFTHTNLAHLAMNSAGLAVICFFFKTIWQRLEFFTLLTLISLLIGLSLLATSTTSYVGLSGTLHGLFGYYAMKEVGLGRKTSLWLLAGLAGKVAWENLVGASASTSALIEARVATEAHLAGALFGVLAAVIVIGCQKYVLTRA